VEFVYHVLGLVCGLFPGRLCLLLDSQAIQNLQMSMLTTDWMTVWKALDSASEVCACEIGSTRKRRWILLSYKGRIRCCSGYQSAHSHQAAHSSSCILPRIRP